MLPATCYYILVFQSDIAVDSGSDVRKFDNGDASLQNALDVDRLRQNVLQKAGDHFESPLCKPSVISRPHLAEEIEATVVLGQRDVTLPTHTTTHSLRTTVLKSNLSKWIARLNGYQLPGPVQTQCKVYNMDK